MLQLSVDRVGWNWLVVGMLAGLMGAWPLAASERLDGLQGFERRGKAESLSKRDKGDDLAAPALDLADAVTEPASTGTVKTDNTAAIADEIANALDNLAVTGAVQFADEAAAEPTLATAATELGEASGDLALADLEN